MRMGLHDENAAAGALGKKAVGGGGSTASFRR